MEDRAVPYHTGLAPVERFLRGELTEDDVDDQGRVVPPTPASPTSLQRAYLRAVRRVEESASPPSSGGSPRWAEAACLEERLVVVERELMLVRRALAWAHIRVPADPYERAPA